MGPYLPLHPPLHVLLTNYHSPLHPLHPIPICFYLPSSLLAQLSCFPISSCTIPPSLHCTAAANHDITGVNLGDSLELISAGYLAFSPPRSTSTGPLSILSLWFTSLNILVCTVFSFILHCNNSSCLLGYGTRPLSIVLQL